jgi:putative oxidoreductase
LPVEYALQRLFSMFPNGLPGAGLLLLRLVCAVFVISGAVTTILGASPTHVIILQSVAVAAALLALAGLWTPVAGLVIVLIELWCALSGTRGIENSILLATLGAALAALGPGAHSIDARLYGRKRIEIDKN